MSEHTRTIYRGKFLELCGRSYELSGGRKAEAEVILHPGGAAVLPFLDAQHVLLIRQLRPALGRKLLELPAGKLDPGEDPLSCAARELQEETGYAAGRMRSLGSMITAPGFCDERLHLYLALDLTPCEARPDEDEEIETVPMAFDEALRMALDGRIDDGKTRLALLLCEMLRLKGGL